MAFEGTYTYYPFVRADPDPNEASVRVYGTPKQVQTFDAYPPPVEAINVAATDGFLVAEIEHVLFENKDLLLRVWVCPALPAVLTPLPQVARNFSSLFLNEGIEARTSTKNGRSTVFVRGNRGLPLLCQHVCFRLLCV